MVYINIFLTFFPYLFQVFTQLEALLDVEKKGRILFDFAERREKQEFLRNPSVLTFILFKSMI